MNLNKKIKHDEDILKSLLNAFHYSNIDEIVQTVINRTSNYKDLNDENFSDLIKYKKEFAIILKAYKRALDNINEFY